MTTKLITPDLSTVPQPETLRPLLEAALAIMEPNDPAREKLQVGITLHSETHPPYCIYFRKWHDDYSESRNVCAVGKTAEEALDHFRSEYKPPLTPSQEIEELESRIAKLRAGK